MFEGYFKELTTKYSKSEQLKEITPTEMKEGGVYVDLGDPSSGWGPSAFILHKILEVKDEEMLIRIELLDDHEDEGLKGDIREWYIQYDMGWFCDAISLENVSPREPDYNDPRRKLTVALRSALQKRIVSEEVIAHYEEQSENINNSEYPDEEINSLADAIRFWITNVGRNPGMYLGENGEEQYGVYKDLFEPAFREVIKRELSPEDAEAIRVYLDGEIKDEW